ncbi:MAG: hypothetical protein A4E27_00734 [Methanobacterium sp. PtaU1.Bin242]|nr:MAG: hypothetical protein A4E27_00734 [Methanobacterium sp. PtaU1.Bin242]
MDYVEGVVKQYQRDYKRSLKSGKTRRYTTKQYTITLPGKTNVDPDEIVAIIPKEKYLDTIGYYENYIGLVN